MVGKLVPLKGGLGGIVHPPIGSIYHLYIAFWGVYATYHPLGEPETTIENMQKPKWNKEMVPPIDGIQIHGEVD